MGSPRARGTWRATSSAYGVDLFHNPDGEVYCLLDAPSVQAVRDHNAALGVDCGEVHESPESADAVG